MKIQYLGHSGILIKDKNTTLIDPWLNDNPLAKIKLSCAPRKKPVSTKFNQAADDRTVLRISKKADIKKVLRRSKSATPKPAGRGRLLSWGANQ